MQFSNLLIYLTVVTTLLLFSAPVAESTFLLFACLRGSRLCPFRTTTSTAAPTPATSAPGDNGDGDDGADGGDGAGGDGADGDGDDAAGEGDGADGDAAADGLED